MTQLSLNGSLRKSVSNVSSYYQDFSNNPNNKESSNSLRGRHASSRDNNVTNIKTEKNIDMKYDTYDSLFNSMPTKENYNFYFEDYNNNNSNISLEIENENNFIEELDLNVSQNMDVIKKKSKSNLRKLLDY